MVGVLVGGLLVWLIKKRKSGLAAFNLKRQQVKSQAKGEILKLLKDKTSISNNDVERLLSVSDATATNYLFSYSLKTNG